MFNYAAQEQIALNQVAQERAAKTAYSVAIVEMIHPSQADVILAHGMGVDLERRDYESSR
jgi:hypothetical protein